MKVKGVQCDEQGCDWRSNDLIVEWLNKPCPKCGKGIIITPEELEYCKKMESGNVSTMIDALGRFPIKDLKEDGTVVLDLKNMRHKT